MDPRTGASLICIGLVGAGLYKCFSASSELKKTGEELVKTNQSIAQIGKEISDHQIAARAGRA